MVLCSSVSLLLIDGKNTMSETLTRSSNMSPSMNHDGDECLELGSFRPCRDFAWFGR